MWLLWLWSWKTPHKERLRFAREFSPKTGRLKRVEWAQLLPVWVESVFLSLYTTLSLSFVLLLTRLNVPICMRTFENSPFHCKTRTAYGLKDKWQSSLCCEWIGWATLNEFYGLTNFEFLFFLVKCVLKGLFYVWSWWDPEKLASMENEILDIWWDSFVESLNICWPPIKSLTY